MFTVQVKRAVCAERRTFRCHHSKIQYDYTEISIRLIQNIVVPTFCGPVQSNTLLHPSSVSRKELCLWNIPLPLGEWLQLHLFRTQQFRSAVFQTPRTVSGAQRTQERKISRWDVQHVCYTQAPFTTTQETDLTDCLEIGMPWDERS